MNDKEYIYNKLKELGVTINPQYGMVFDSHINVLLYRLKNNECVYYEDSSFVNELSNRSMDIAHQILDPLFEKYHVYKNEIEIGLFAIYINL